MKIVPHDHVFRFRKEFVCCPICGAQVVGHVEAWVEAEDGLWTAEQVKLDCVEEPENMDCVEWEDWFRSHWSMPYVDWLPLEIAVTKAVNKRYRFKMEERNGGV